MEAMTNTPIKAFKLSNHSPISSTLAKFWDILRPNKKFRGDQRCVLGCRTLSLKLFLKTWRCRLRHSSCTTASLKIVSEGMSIAFSIKRSFTLSPTIIMLLSWIGDLRNRGTMSRALDLFSRKRWSQTGWRISTQTLLLSRVNHQDSRWRT